LEPARTGLDVAPVAASSEPREKEDLVRTVFPRCHQARRHPRGGELSTVVAVALGVCVSLAGTSANADPFDYTIGQFNMAGGNDGETGGLSGTEAPDALLASIRDRQPVFITIQEGCRDWSEYMDAQLPDYEVRFEPVFGGNGSIASCKHSPKSDFGNAIIYRSDLDIDGSVFFHLGSPPGKEQREMLCVTSTTRKLAICSIHTTSDDVQARRDEAAVARGFLATEFPGYTRFVGGDLNDDPMSGVTDNFYDTGYGHGAHGEFKEVDSPCGNSIAESEILSFNPPIVVQCRDGESTHGNIFVRQKLDYLFVPPSVFVRAADATSAVHSDHDPLWAWVTVDLPPPPGPSPDPAPGPDPIDSTPPASIATPATPANARGWNNTDVTIQFGAVDTGEIASGVMEVRVTLSGAQMGTSVLAGGTGTVTITAEGTTTVSYFAIDNADNAESIKTLTVRLDKTPPAIAGMPGAGCSLWPPNHKLVEVATASASDGVSGVDTFDVTGGSNEPEGNKGPDIVITGSGLESRVVQLRAERLGNGDGRVYSLTATASDQAGNAATAAATCTVPHDQGGSSAAALAEQGGSSNAPGASATAGSAEVTGCAVGGLDSTGLIVSVALTALLRRRRARPASAGAGSSAPRHREAS
jgi:endonuclease/exonuclease/phosphatase family metal-dependent hydrolase